MMTDFHPGSEGSIQFRMAGAESLKIYLPVRAASNLDGVLGRIEPYYRPLRRSKILSARSPTRMTPTPAMAPKSPPTTPMRRIEVSAPANPSPSTTISRRSRLRMERSAPTSISPVELLRAHRRHAARPPKIMPNPSNATMTVPAVGPRSPAAGRARRSISAPAPSTTMPTTQVGAAEDRRLRGIL